MYIKDIGWGSKDNKRSFQCVYWDMDTHPILKSSGSHAPRTPNVTSDNIALSFTSNISDMNYSGNAETIELIKSQLGPITNPDYAVFPKVNYNNDHTTELSYPQIEYEEVELTEEEPENWDVDSWQYYYTLENEGESNQFYENLRLYGGPSGVYDTTTKKFSWSALRQWLIDHNKKLYRNTEVTKWVYVGSGDKQVMFIATKRGVCLPNYVKRPDTVIFKRECRISGTSFKWKYGGQPRVGLDVQPESEDVVSYYLQADDYTIIGNNGLRAFTVGRYSVDYTLANPITDCTLMMFGFVIYNGRRYFGAFKFGWEPKYYWGYSRYDSVPSSRDWSSVDDLDPEKPVNYDEVPDNIYLFEFSGICLDEIEVSVETGDGKIPHDVPSSFIYPSIPLGLVGDRSFGLLADGNSHGFHVYYMESSEFQELTERLWNWGRFVKQAFNAIEEHSLLDIASMWLNGSIQYGIFNQMSMDPTNCIVFARKMPAFVGRATSATKYTVFIGGNFQDGLQSYVFDTYEVIQKQNNLVIEFDAPTESFLDYSPYTEANLYLPYVGQVNIDPCVCAGGRIEISYVADIMSGLCSVLVRTEIERLGEHRNVRYGPFVADCSLMVPIAMSDSNAMQRNQAVVKAAVSSVTGYAEENMGAESVNGIKKAKKMKNDPDAVETDNFHLNSGFVDATITPRKLSTVTGIGNNAGTMCPWDVVLQIVSSAPYMFNETTESLGLKCYKIGKMKDFKGFSRIDWIDLENFDFSTFAMTETEEEMIVDILKGGVFL